MLIDNQQAGSQIYQIFVFLAAAADLKMCILTDLSGGIFSCRSVDLIFLLISLATPCCGLSWFACFGLYGCHMPADMKEVLDHAWVVSLLDASLGKGQ